MAEEQPDGHSEAVEKTLKLLTEDIQSHRDYIHRLYRSAFTVGAVLLAVGVGLAYWVLGKQLDARVFEYRVVESLRERARDISQEIVKDSKLAAKEEVNRFIKEKLSKEVESQIKPKLQELSTENLAALFEKFAFPYGSVIPLNRDSCPIGWDEYTPAYGRFIRGIDKSGTVDPDGIRLPGSLQTDQLQTHRHRVREGIVQSFEFGHQVGGLFAPASGPRATVDNYPNTTEPIGSNFGSETRPKNVSLLYCIKNNT